MTITVVDVVRAMGVEPTPALTWSLGNAVRDMYFRKFGDLPVKDLRPKTNDGGTHCFAIYPDEMRSEIEAIVRLFQTQDARQFELFPRSSPPTRINNMDDFSREIGRLIDAWRDRLTAAQMLEVIEEQSEALRGEVLRKGNNNG